MYMKRHILAALREEFDRWEELLAPMSETQLTSPYPPSPWSIKDEIAHLWAWQQRSIARCEAAQFNREPDFPQWPAELDPNAEGQTDRINAWIYESYREQTWPQIHQNWRAGFQRFLAAADAIPERDLLDTGRYSWLNGYPLAFILLASYNHHHEHLEKLLDRLQKCY